MKDAQPAFAEKRVMSQDGTKIGYKSAGKGPGLVIVHGTFRTSQHYRQIASHLTDCFTVHIPDRRGRGGSGPQGEGYELRKECEDVAALLRETGSAFLFGHSYGGLIGLETALMFPNLSLRKLALYEPGISIANSFPSAWISDYERALAKGNRRKAFAILIIGLRLIHTADRLPGWLLSLLLRLAAMGPSWKQAELLLPTLTAEIAQVRSLDSTVEKYSAIGIDTLLMAGTKSPDYLLLGTLAVKETVRHSNLLLLPGLDHNGPDEHAPAAVAEHLKQYFA